jgi:uncharacterized protein HemX
MNSRMLPQTDSAMVQKMSAPIAVLIAILFTLAAGLAAQVGKGVSNDPSERNENVAQTDVNSSDDKSEQKRISGQTDSGLVKKASKKRDDVCVENCPGFWRRYELTPWPIYQLRDRFGANDP